MKSKLLQVRKMLLVAAGLLVGASAWAETTIYEKGTTGNAWAESDLEDWTNSNPENVTFSITGDGLKFALNAVGRTEYTATKAIQTTEDKVTLTTVWNTGTATGSNTAGNYLIFGDVKLFFCGQTSILSIAINGTEDNIMTGSSASALRGQDLNVVLTINKKSKVVDYAISCSAYNGGTPVTGTGVVGTNEISSLVFGWARGGQQTQSNQIVKSVVITEEEDASELADYTLKYVDTNNATLKTVTIEKGGTVGEKVTVASSYKETFYDSDENPTKKYIYKEDDAEEITISSEAENNVITLTFDVYEKISYTVTAKNGNSSLKELAKGEAYTDGSTTISYSKFIDVDGFWYETTSPYAVQVNKAEIEITYKASDITYFFEMEDLARTGGAATIIETSNTYSNGKRARISSSATLYTPALAGGTYKLSIPWENGNDGSDEVYVYTRTAEGVLSDKLETFTASKGSGTFSATITVPASHSIAFNGNEGSNNNKARMDYMTLTCTGVTATIASSGYSTLASACSLDFSDVDGLTAYIVTEITSDAVKLEKVNEVPANTGVILKGTGDASYSIPVKADATFSGTNLLKAAVTATEIGANEAYILQGGEFHLVTAASEVPAGKAYLEATAGARTLSFLFGGETTGIAEIEKAGAGNGAIYNLSGQRISKPANGLYIMNGKKVIIK